MLTTARIRVGGRQFHGGGQNMDGNVCPNGVSVVRQTLLLLAALEVDSRVTAAAPLYYGMLLVSQIGDRRHAGHHGERGQRRTCTPTP